MKHCLIPIFLFFSLPAHAGTLYRCGNTFSQIPCGDDAKTVQIPSGDRGKSALPPDLAKHVCVNDLKKWVPFPDPDSIKVASVSRGVPEIIEYAGTKLMARRYDLRISAPNAYGGLAFRCFASEDNQRILKIVALRE